MTAFEHCHSCKPPVRHPGCHSECPHYQVGYRQVQRGEG